MGRKSATADARITANMDRIAHSSEIEQHLHSNRLAQVAAAKHCRCAERAIDLHDDARAHAEINRAIASEHVAYCGLTRLIEEERALRAQLVAENAAMTVGISPSSLRAEVAA